MDTLDLALNRIASNLDQYFVDKSKWKPADDSIGLRVFVDKPRNINQSFTAFRQVIKWMYAKELTNSDEMSQVTTRQWPEDQEAAQFPIFPAQRTSLINRLTLTTEWS